MLSSFSFDQSLQNLFITRESLPNPVTITVQIQVPDWGAFIPDVIFRCCGELIDRLISALWCRCS